MSCFYLLKVFVQISAGIKIYTIVLKFSQQCLYMYAHSSRSLEGLTLVTFEK